MVTIGPLDKSNPSTRFRGSAWVISQDVATNKSKVRFQIEAWNGPSGNTTSHSNYWGTHWIGGDGIGVREEHRADIFLPSGYAANAERWSEFSDHEFSHDADGYLGNFTIRMHLEYANGAVNEEHIAYLGFDRIPKAPKKPPKPVYQSSSTTTVEYIFFGSQDNGGSGETEFNHQSATDSNFTQNVRNWNDSDSPGQATNLAPGTRHFIRFRSKNAIGYSPWTDALEVTTLPSVPPGLSVVASPSGTSATLTFSPPGGVTGVTRYVWERWVTGGNQEAWGESFNTVQTVTGLEPGRSYNWRAYAEIGSYASPWTGWVTLVQPKPNTAPGDYFDGNSPDTGDIDYQWMSTPNASGSVAVASGVAGWGADFSGGTAGMVYRITAGIVGSAYAARVQITADGTPGVFGSVHAGQAWGSPHLAQVTGGVTYIGSIHVRPSRGQSLAAIILWLDPAGTFMYSSTGAPTSVPGGTWLRLGVGAVAPAGAGFAIVRVIDVDGPGWSVWRGGDAIDLDGAMLSLEQEFPYFDGNTSDTGDFIYAWTGAANASPSTRTPVALALAASSFDSPDLLAGCVVPPKPPRQPSIPSDCIEDVGVWRRYYVDIPSANVSDWLASVLTLRVSSGAVAANQVRIRVYPNPFERPSVDVDTTTWCAEQIVSYLPSHTLLTLDGVTQRAWAEVNGGNPQSADHLLYGTGGTPATWPVLSCGIAYLVSLEVPIDAPDGNVVIEAALTMRT